jgi:hypothetical protein
LPFTNRDKIPAPSSVSSHISGFSFECAATTPQISNLTWV